MNVYGHMLFAITTSKTTDSIREILLRQNQRDRSHVVKYRLRYLEVQNLNSMICSTYTGGVKCEVAVVVSIRRPFWLICVGSCTIYGIQTTLINQNGLTTTAALDVTSPVPGVVYGCLSSSECHDCIMFYQF